MRKRSLPVAPTPPAPLPSAAPARRAPWLLVLLAAPAFALAQPQDSIEFFPEPATPALDLPPDPAPEPAPVALDFLPLATQPAFEPPQPTPGPAPAAIALEFLPFAAQPDLDAPSPGAAPRPVALEVLPEPQPVQLAITLQGTHAPAMALAAAPEAPVSRSPADPGLQLAQANPARPGDRPAASQRPATARPAASVIPPPAPAPPAPPQLAARPPPPAPPPAPPRALPPGIEALPRGGLRLGAAALDAPQRAALAEIGREWASETRGRVNIWSEVALPAQDPHTARRIALARAQAIKAALVEGGLPATRIDLRPQGRTQAGIDRLDVLPPGVDRSESPR